MVCGKNKILGLALISLCLAIPALAIASPNLPPAKPLLQAYSMAGDQGFAQNWAVQQGSDGLIYVGGNSSLLIFDGVDWRSVKTPDDGRVRDLEIDQQGRVWVASPGEFGYFSRDQQEQLIYHSISQYLPEDQRDFGETRFVRVLGDDVYFNTHERLYRWADGQLSSFAKWDGLFRLTFTANGRYYVVSGNRIYDFTEFPDDVAPPAPEERWRWPDKAKITFLYQWDDQQLLLGTYDDGLYLLSESEPRHFNDDATVRSAWPYSAFRMTDGTVVVSSIQSGIFWLDQQGHLIEHIDTKLGLPVNTTLGMGTDHDDGLWLAQDGAVTRVDLNSSLRIYDKDSNVAQVRALIDFGGHLLVGGSPSLGVLQADNGLTSLRPLDVPIAQESFDLLVTDQGVMLSGFNGVHLLQIEPDFSRLESSENLFQDTYTYGLFPSRVRDVIYVESENGIGILVRENGNWHALPKVAGMVDRPATFAEDSQGRVWVGSGDGRYQRYTWRDSQSLELDITLGAEQGVPPGNAHVFQLGDRLIFGTTLGGYRLVEDGPETSIEPDPFFGNEQLGDDQKEVFKFYSPDESNIMAVIGAKQAIWRGLVKADGNINWFGPQLLQMDPGNVNSLSEAQGTLWIGQSTNLLRFDWPAAEPLPASQTRLNLRWVGFPDRQNDQQQVLLHGPLSSTTQPPEKLPNSQDALRFEYALASYSRPDKTQYRVWLEGHDQGWSRWTAESRRDYTNLSGGKYRFKVQAQNVFGAVSESTPFAFGVNPPWYLSTPAWLIWILSGLAMLWFAAGLGRRRKQQRLLDTQHQLELEVASRTAEVRQQAKKLRELNEAKSRFFANVSHEFRTPLTLVKGPLEELVRGDAGNLNEEANRFIGMALRNTETLQALIGQILDVNRLESGQMPISITRDDLAAHVKRQVAEFEAQAKQEGVNIIVTGCDETVEVDFDPGHMATIIRNLLGNALKFTAAGGHVEVHCDASEENVELSVTDSGCGISSNELPHIFERYYQGDQTHASKPGTGIGLSLVNELVQLHQGTANASSVVGEGTCIVLCFPRHLPGLQKPVALKEPSGSQDDVGSINSQTRSDYSAAVDDDNVPTILIVDDNAELRSFLNLRLRGSYRVLEAGNGEEGLELAKAELPDVIVTDVMMPKMTGLEMTAALRSDSDTDFIPVLMLSARTTRRDTVAGLQQGADDYLAKPFDSAELAARVAGLIASRRKLQARLQTRETVAEVSSVFLQKASQIAGEHLSEADFGTRDWAALMHMDRTTLYRKLKEETELSPEEFLREQRLLLAAALLQAKAGNVSQVAVNVGFNSISYFSTRFKERFGVTPAAYTRNQASQEPPP